MYPYSEEFYTYRHILFPQTPKARTLIHTCFWIIFISFHLLYFVPSHDYVLINPTLLGAYILYYGRYIPLYYLMIGFFRKIRAVTKGVKRDILLVLYVVTSHHLITTALFVYLKYFIGIQNLTDSFQLHAGFYLDPLSRKHSYGLGVLIYDITELQLFILPACVKVLKYSVGLLHRRAEKLESELKFLRAQLPPHFIFNLLHGLTVEIKRSPAQATKKLIQVADMIRFSLYQIDQEYIELQKELAHIEHLVNFEQDSSHLRAELCFNVEGDPVLPTHKIPPLSLLTLVENAFKHGVHATAEQSYVAIFANVCDTWLTFEITNSKPSKKPVKKSEHQTGGIGLSNVRRTLQLRYGKNHKLEIIETNQTFSVTLKIPLYQQIQH